MQLRPYNPSDRPLTNVSVPKSGLNSPKQTTSIKVSNLMSNGVSYPAAKKIVKNSTAAKQSSVLRVTRGSVNNDSILSQLSSQDESAN